MRGSLREQDGFTSSLKILIEEVAGLLETVVSRKLARGDQVLDCRLPFVPRNRESEARGEESQINHRRE